MFLNWTMNFLSREKLLSQSNSFLKILDQILFFRKTKFLNSAWYVKKACRRILLLVFLNW
jgi:hypothetical protein